MSTFCGLHCFLVTTTFHQLWIALNVQALDTASVAQPPPSDAGNTTGIIQNAQDTKIVPVLLDQLGPAQDTPAGGGGAEKGSPASIKQYTYDFTGETYFHCLFLVCKMYASSIVSWKCVNNWSMA